MYSPNIFTNDQSALSVRTIGGITYAELMQALGSFYFPCT
jgi:hypothetical protein